MFIYNSKYRVYLIQNLYFGFTRRVLYNIIYIHTHTHTQDQLLASSFCSFDCNINLICVQLYNFGFKIILNIWHYHKGIKKVQTNVLYPKRFERPHCIMHIPFEGSVVNCSFRYWTIKMLRSKIMWFF